MAKCIYLKGWNSELPMIDHVPVPSWKSAKAALVFVVRTVSKCQLMIVRRLYR